jgi:hypothetical protein
MAKVEDVSKEEPMQEDEQQDDGEAEDDSPSCNYCTFAVTGGIPSFQPIFICHECFNENSSDQEVPLCICQACADICHNSNDHDVEYIGMGPSYCDCDCVGNCLIYQKSLIEAERLGVVSSKEASPPTEESKPQQAESPTTMYVQDVYDIPILQNATTANILVQHAQELIQHSKETFWVDKSSSSSSTELCAFEQLAWSIYQRHGQHYESLQGKTDGGGAEWWVQVKDINNDGSAIDLHYDKDEALAESFGIGSFPVLSTVTYLTASKKTAAPTIVFDHTYTQGEEDLMNTMLISRPRLGKHLIFDGTLLHGAPSHSFLQPIDDEKPSEEKSTNEANNTDDSDDKSKESTAQPAKDEVKKKVRVTFLVNIWKDRRPASVQVIDDTIRQKLLLMTSPSLESPLVMMEQSIPKVELNKEEELPKALQHRIELPFVTKGVTGEEQLNTGADNDDGGLVVITFPPPPTDDTLLVTFGPGLQAYLDYPQKQEESEQEGKQEGKQEEERESGYV